MTVNDILRSITLFNTHLNYFSPKSALVQADLDAKASRPYRYLGKVGYGKSIAPWIIRFGVRRVSFKRLEPFSRIMYLTKCMTLQIPCIKKNKKSDATANIHTLRTF